MATRGSSITSSKTSLPRYPYTFHRRYLCGHPDESIIVDRPHDTLLQHTITEPSRGNNSTLKLYQQDLQRCLACAEEHCAERRHNNPSERQPRSLAAHQGQAQGGEGWLKDGFLHTLRRKRFFGSSEWSIHWLEEKEKQTGLFETRFWEDLHSKSEEGRSIGPHPGIEFEDRVGRRKVEGPMRQGHDKVAYVLQTAIHADLAPDLGHDMFSSESPTHSRVHGERQSQISFRDLPSDVAKHRDLALRQLEGRADEEHSGSTVLHQPEMLAWAEGPPQTHVTFPAYCQRPFDPTRSSGSTALSEP